MRKQLMSKTNAFFKPSKYYFPSFLFALFLITLVVGKNLASFFNKEQATSIQANAYSDAEKIDEKCRRATEHEQCFAKAFYVLTQKHDPQYSVETLLSLQKIAPKYTRGCHFIAHKISQAQTEKNPELWEDVIKSVPPTLCTGGFLHGVLEAHLATDPEFKIDEKSITHICRNVLKENTKNWFIENSCSHNLGHLMIIQEEGQLTKAVEKCEKIIDPTFHYECLSGTFMERLTAENLLAHKLIKTKPRWNVQMARDTEKVCAKFSGLAEKACWKELSYVYSSMHSHEPRALYKECQRAPAQDIRDECYIYGAGNMVSAGRFKPENLMSLCHDFVESGDMFKRCMQHTVGALLASTTDNLDRTLSICERTYQSYQTKCYSQIIYALAHNNAPQHLLRKTCAQMTREIRKQVCHG